MRRLVIAALALGFGFSSAAYAATPCRDASGKFIKCAPVPPTKCRDAKGKFTKCEPALGKSG
jgi:hypothetical protein